MNEIIERKDVFAGERRLGCLSVRYPEFEHCRIDRFYRRVAEAFIVYAEKRSLCGMLCCRVSYEDEENASVIIEARLYREGEAVRRHRSSLVWDKKKQRLRYLRRRGIRCCNVSYDGTDLRFFD